MRWRAHAAKSSKTFCLRVRFPARCHSSPNSPPPRRLEFQREKPPRSRDEAGVRGRVFCVERGEPRLNARAVGERVAVGARVFVLRVRPRLHGGRGGVFEPAIVIHHFHPVILIRDGLLFRRRIIGGCGRQERGHGDGGGCDERRFHDDVRGEGCRDERARARPKAQRHASSLRLLFGIPVRRRFQLHG
jgi:hypothetical protein